MSKKYLLYTDGDLDGIGCAVLVKIAFGEDNVEIHYGREINQDIKKLLIRGNDYKSYEKIFITDTSVNKEIADEIDALEDNNFKLFDHHLTAKWLNSYSWAVIKDTDITIPKKKGDNCQTYKISATRVFFDYLKMNNMIKRINNMLIDFVSLVSDYDTWNWATNDKKEAKWLNDLFFFYGRDTFIEKALHKINFSDINNSQFNFNNEDIELLKILKEKENKYVEEHMKNIWLIETSYNDKKLCLAVTFAESHISTLGHALAEEYKSFCDGVAIITPRGTVEFRGVKDDVDISEYAKYKNGGGHPKACGCPIDGDNIKQFIYKIFDLKDVGSIGRI